ncbi:MAG TPA: aminotransferase class I/II-fold pyridoxal phosphate-dependent enzyme, partial [Ruminococcus flavefaciens]|nr:aminotransferase class I/II-fold pyridoxal phosphate-dependent enzyme [Ruminococcus flavefaciens]
MIDYDKVLSDKIKKIKPSGIRKFFDIAGTMEGVISLGVGEPDFNTPWVIRKAAIQVLERRHIVYGPNKGLAPLRGAISDNIAKKHGITYDPDKEMIVTVGGSEAIDLAVRGLIDPGDEVLVVEPCFVCYAPLVELVGGVAVPVPTRLENNFKLTVDDLKDKVTERTKLLILPFPNNPTGAIMTKEDLEPIAEFLRGTDIIVLSDEIYSELTYGRKHFSIIELEGMRERTIYVNGFSKAYAMTGWRLGYVAAPEPIITQI